MTVPTRRMLLAVTLALGPLATNCRESAPGTQAPPAPAPNGAVQVDGGRFVLDGRPFYFVGANSRELIHLWHHAVYDRGNGNVSKQAAARILYSQLLEANKMGVSVMRVFLPHELTTEQQNIDRLRYLLDFATKDYAQLDYDGSEDDYRRLRTDYYGSGLVAPAPQMKFLVVLTDFYYTCSRIPDPTVGQSRAGNLVLKGELGAYKMTNSNDAPQEELCEQANEDIYHLVPEWFERGNSGGVYSGPRFADSYLPFVRSVAAEFRGDPRIFAFEVGNEMKVARTGPPEPAQTMRDFLQDVVCAIKGIGCMSTQDQEDSAGDATRLVSTGFMSSGHASYCVGGDSACAEAARETIYAPQFNSQRLIDFGSVHYYDEGNANDQSADLKTSLAGTDMPYVVGEFSYKYDGSSRAEKVRRGLGTLYDTKGAGGVLQWELYGSREQPRLPYAEDVAYGPTTTSLGLDISNSDYADLFWIYACRAAYFQNLANGFVGTHIDLATLNVDWDVQPAGAVTGSWSNFTNPDLSIVPGDKVTFHARICNVGNLATDQGIGMTVYLDNNVVAPQIMYDLGNAYVPTDLEPGELARLDFDWKAVDPNELDPALTMDDVAVVALADDIDRYPAPTVESTEANNGYAAYLTMHACPGPATPRFNQATGLCEACPTGLEWNSDRGMCVGDCGILVQSTSRVPEAFSFQLDKGWATVQFVHFSEVARTRMIVLTDKNGDGEIDPDREQVFDSGCEWGTKTDIIDNPGHSAPLIVDVIPNCDGSTGASWGYELSCPFCNADMTGNWTGDWSIPGIASGGWTGGFVHDLLAGVITGSGSATGITGHPECENGTVDGKVDPSCNVTWTVAADGVTCPAVFVGQSNAAGNEAQGDLQISGKPNGTWHGTKASQ